MDSAIDAVVAGRASGAPKRILIVDDDEDAGELLALILRRFGHGTRTATDGQAALEAAVAELPDVVIVNVGLPGMSGYEVAERLRENDKLADKTLIALAAWDDRDDKKRALAAGFDFHLGKPFSMKELQTSLGATETVDR